MRCSDWQMSNYFVPITTKEKAVEVQNGIQPQSDYALPLQSSEKKLLPEKTQFNYV